MGWIEIHARRDCIPLLRASAMCDVKAARARHRKCHRGGDEVERAAVAPGDQGTSDKPQDVRRRSQQPREPLTPEMLTLQLEMKFR